MKQKENNKDMKLYLFLIPFFILITNVSYSQVSIGIKEKPAKGALLDLKTSIISTVSLGNESADKGLLLPRVILTSMSDLTPFITSANSTQKQEHTGLTVYNINSRTPFKAGIYIWNGSRWEYSIQENNEAPIFDGINGITKNSSTSGLRLGGILTENTTINHMTHGLRFNQTTGGFTVNNNQLAIIGGNVGIGFTPTLMSAKLTVGGDAKISDNLTVTSSTNLKKTNINNKFIYNDGKHLSPKKSLLKATNNNGSAEWIAVDEIPNYNPPVFVEATFTGSGINIPVTNNTTNWNSGTNYVIPDAKFTLTPGTWLIYLSVTIQPEIVSTSVYAPIWARLGLKIESRGVYSDLASSRGAVFIGGREIADRVYPNVSKNVMKGYLIVQATSTVNLVLNLGNRSQTTNGYVPFPATVKSVTIGDSSDPQNYIVAFPL